MKAGKRGVLGIVANILDSLAATPLEMEDLAFKSSLDSRTAAKYMAILLELELVGKSEYDTSYFVITQKGRDFLEQYKPVHTF